NAYHEMGHAIGLAHPYFHTGSSLPLLFGPKSIDGMTYPSIKLQCVDYLDANSPSMMAYNPGSFSTSPRIELACHVAGYLRGGVAGAIVRAQARLKRAQPGVGQPQTKPKKKRRGSGGAEQAQSEKKRELQSKPEIEKMNLEQVTQLLEDLLIVQEY